jgi:hypothetical protein
MAGICSALFEPVSVSMNAVSCLQLPTPISLAVKGLHCCHFFGKTMYRLEARYQHPGLYVAGVIAHAHFGNEEFFQMVAQIVRVARIFLFLVEDAAAIVHSCHRLKEAFVRSQGVTTYYTVSRLTSPRWAKQEGSAPSMLFLPWPLALLVSQCMLVSMRVSTVIQQIWQLNMHLFDMDEALKMDPQTRASAIDDLFVDLGTMVNDEIGKERKLSKAVQEHGQWIDEVLRLLRVNWSAQEVAKALDQLADQAVAIGQTRAACAGVMVTRSMAFAARTFVMV